MERLIERLDPSDLQLLTSKDVFKHYSFSARERNCLFVNAGGTGFVEAGYPLGIDVDLEGRGVAVADFDQDGRLDLLVRSVARQKVTYLRNQVMPRANFLRVDLEARSGQREAIGAVVRLRTDGVQQMRLRRAGSGFQSQSESILHFGLGASERVESLSVRWPSGLEQRFENLPADHLVRLVEGEDQPQLERLPGWTGREERDPARRPISWHARHLDGDLYRPPNGRPVLLTFWASWCGPCHAEVRHLNALAERYGGALEVIGVTLEDGLASAQEFAARTGASYPLLTGAPEIFEPLLDLAFGDGVLPLPASVLIDAEGTVRRVFGAVPPEILDRQVAHLVNRSRIERPLAVGQAAK